MQRVMVIGCPGSGKSTFARALHRLTGLPLYYLDRMNWNADRTTVEKAVFRARLEETVRRSEWIIDGNYGSTIELRLRACDTVFFLDYPPQVCIEGVRERRGRPREDMPWAEREGEEDEEFLAFIRNYGAQSRPKVLELLAQYPHKEIHVFTCREEAQAFLRQLREGAPRKEQ